MTGARASIRRGVMADVAEVMEIERGVEEAPHWSEAEYRVAVARGADSMVRRCLFVAEGEGGVVGFAVGRCVEGTGEIESVAVAVAARRQGIGGALCGAVVRWCSDEGAEGVELEVRAGSEGAISMYGALGFAVVGRRPRYYAEPAEDAVLMRLVMAMGGE